MKHPLELRLATRRAAAFPDSRGREDTQDAKASTAQQGGPPEEYAQCDKTHAQQRHDDRRCQQHRARTRAIMLEQQPASGCTRRSHQQPDCPGQPFRAISLHQEHEHGTEWHAQATGQNEMGKLRVTPFQLRVVLRLRLTAAL